MLRRLYDWCIAAADKPYATWLMGIVSFVESSFFPVPPDAMLIPMSLARPDKAWFYATLCTLTSVAGGVLGYFIGAVLYDPVGLWVVKLYGLTDKVEAFREAYAQWGTWIILIKGMTPIPYKLVTIASGFADIVSSCSSCFRLLRAACGFISLPSCSTDMACRRAPLSRNDWDSGSPSPRSRSSAASLPHSICSDCSGVPHFRHAPRAWLPRL
jgi:membrane protein YqaA with SNARE-associated domain